MLGTDQIRQLNSQINNNMCHVSYLFNRNSGKRLFTDRWWADQQEQTSLNSNLHVPDQQTAKTPALTQCQEGKTSLVTLEELQPLSINSGKV